MTPSPQTIPIPTSPLPVHTPHPARSPHSPAMLDARPPHPDFLGAPDTQESHYLQDTLGLHLNFDVNPTSLRALCTHLTRLHLNSTQST